MKANKKVSYRDQHVIGLHGRKRVYVTYDAPRDGNIIDAHCHVNGKRVKLVKVGDEWFPVKGGQRDIQVLGK